MESITPLGTRILVKRLRVEDQQRESGIVVPGRTVTPTYKNEIVALGSEVSRPVRVGDVVLTTQFVGDQVLDLQETLYLMEEGDLLAVIQEVEEEVVLSIPGLEVTRPGVIAAVELPE